MGQQGFVNRPKSSGGTGGGGKLPPARPPRPWGERSRDLYVFVRSFLKTPLTTGAQLPSSRQLAEAMADLVDIDRPGMVVELGPGTGPVTEALLAKGLPEDRLVMIELNPDFCSLLRRRFPKARVLHGSAYDLLHLLAGIGITPHDTHPVIAVVSSLPLATHPENLRRGLLRDGLTLMGAAGRIIQFTYFRRAPMPLDEPGISGARVRWLPFNVWPASVWMYQGTKPE